MLLNTEHSIAYLLFSRIPETTESVKLLRKQLRLIYPELYREPALRQQKKKKKGKGGLFRPSFSAKIGGSLIRTISLSNSKNDSGECECE